MAQPTALLVGALWQLRNATVADRAHRNGEGVVQVETPQRFASVTAEYGICLDGG